MTRSRIGGSAMTWGRSGGMAPERAGLRAEAAERAGDDLSEVSRAGGHGQRPDLPSSHAQQAGGQVGEQVQRLVGGNPAARNDLRLPDGCRGKEPRQLTAGFSAAKYAAALENRPLCGVPGLHVPAREVGPARRAAARLVFHGLLPADPHPVPRPVPVIPASRAISAIASEVSMTIRAASSRNSGVYVLHFPGT